MQMILYSLGLQLAWAPGTPVVWTETGFAPRTRVADLASPPTCAAVPSFSGPVAAPVPWFLVPPLSAASSSAQGLQSLQERGHISLKKDFPHLFIKVGQSHANLLWSLQSLQVRLINKLLYPPKSNCLMLLCAFISQITTLVTITMTRVFIVVVVWMRSDQLLQSHLVVWRQWWVHAYLYRIVESIFSFFQ